ncbi:MAG TPA: CPBP family intramembrane glutamic endopeptidase [Alloacidobacterium sp.]|nr:CPBP family intramembrane glutamic endopeptidase [Alloacidobacterium sp.]
MNPRIDPRLRDLLEIISAYGLILAVIWTPMPAQRILYWLAIVVVIGITVLRRETLRSLGLAPGEGWRAFWIVVSAVVLAALAVATARLLGTLHSLPRIGHLSMRTRVTGYLIWSFVQEFLLQVFFLTRLIRLIPRRSLAIVVAALLFAGAHVPNPVLIWLTLLWGFIACPLFLRYRNLYALGLAHGILGICVAITVPDALHHHMRVGLGYLHYHPRYHRLQRSSAPHTVSTQAWVIDEAAILLSERHARP